MSFYILRNIVLKEQYFFLGFKDKETKLLVDKLINKSIKASELQILKDTYTNDLDLSAKVYNFDLQYLNILELKTFIFVLLDIPVEKQHLWIINNDLEYFKKQIIKNREDNDEVSLTEYPYILGYEYKNNVKGIKYLDPNILDLDNVFMDENDILEDKHSYILNNYSVKDNVIYLVDFDNYNSLDIEEDLKKTIIEIYYPFLKKLDTSILATNKTQYREIFDNINKNIEDFSYNLSEIKFRLITNKYNNVVLYLNYGSNQNLNLEYLFENVHANNDVPFIKFKNYIKNEFYKIDKNLIYNIDRIPDVKKNFSDSNQYFVEYKNIKQTITGKTLRSWKENMYILREKKLSLKTNETLTFKLNLNDIYNTLYCNLIINNNGLVEIKLFNDLDNNEFNFTLEELNSIYKRIDTFLNFLKKFEPNLQTIEDNEMLEYVNINSTFIVDLPEKVDLTKIKKVIKKYYFFSYLMMSLQTSKGDGDNVYIKFKPTKIFNTYENIKHFYYELKMAKTLETLDEYGVKKELSVEEFRDVWVTETKIKFNLSELDSIKLLQRITEEQDIKIPSTNEANNRLSINKDNIDIIISEGKELGPLQFRVKILNANNLDDIKNVNKFLETVFSVSLKKDLKIDNSIPESKPLIVQNVKLPTVMVGEDNMNINISDSDSDNDSNSNSNSDNDNNNQVPSGGAPAPKPGEVSKNKSVLDTENNNMDIGVYQQPKSIRSYMENLRKRDKDLFFYKSLKKTDGYPKKCGAVDMRQPFLLNKRELENMKIVNLEGFNDVKDTILMWGSSSKKQFYYICPRIWCIKCKIVLTAKQFLDSDGTCKFCGGGKPIDPNKKTIKKNETVLIKRGKSNNYWGKGDASDNAIVDIKDLPEEFVEQITSGKTEIQKKIILKKYKALWQKHLKGSEKTASPSLIDPKVHADGLCMPCCALPITIKAEGQQVKSFKNIEKCLKHDVDMLIDDSKIDKINLIRGKPLDGVILENGMVVALLNKSETNGIYVINDDNPMEVMEYGPSKLNFVNGLVINVKMTGEQFKIIKKDGIIYKRLYADTGPKVDYILGPEKFPLLNKKYGILSEKTDKLFNGSSYAKMTDKRILDIGNTLILRKGIIKNSESSLLYLIASLKNLDIEEYLKILIEFLTPQIFVSLNHGEIFKYFCDDEIKYDKNIKQFLDWCKTYIDFVKILGSEFILDYSEKKLLNEPRFIILYNVYNSYENYKKYLCNLNTFKDLHLIQDLVSRENPKFIVEGLNIFVINIFDSLESNFTINNPYILDKNNFYKPDRHNLVIIKRQDLNLYEPLYEVQGGSMEDAKYNFTLKKNRDIVENIRSVLYKYTSSTLSFYNIVDELNGTEYELDKIIIDKYFKGIGILCKNNVIIYTLPFSVDFRYNIVTKSDLRDFKLDVAIEQYKLLEEFILTKFKKKYLVKDIVLDSEDNIIGIQQSTKSDNFFIPVRVEKKKDMGKSFEFVKINSYKYWKTIEDVLILKHTERKDERSSINDRDNLDRLFYNNLKYEISQILSKNINLRNKLVRFLKNDFIDVTIKVNVIYELLLDLGDSLVKSDELKMISDDDYYGTCQSVKDRESCNSLSKCLFDTNETFSVDNEKYDIISDDMDIDINVEPCKMTLDKDNLNRLLFFISQEIVKFLGKRNEIIYGKYKIIKKVEKKSNNLYLTKYDFDENIETIFNKKMYIYVNNYFSKIKDIINELKIETVKSFSTKLDLTQFKSKKKNSVKINKTNTSKKNNNTKPVREAIKFFYKKDTKEKIFHPPLPTPLEKWKGLDKQPREGICRLSQKKKGKIISKKKYCHPVAADVQSYAEEDQLEKCDIEGGGWGYCVPEGQSKEEYKTKYGIKTMKRKTAKFFYEKDTKNKIFHPGPKPLSKWKKLKKNPKEGTCKKPCRPVSDDVQELSEDLPLEKCDIEEGGWGYCIPEGETLEEYETKYDSSGGAPAP